MSCSVGQTAPFLYRHKECQKTTPSAQIMIEMRYHICLRNEDASALKYSSLVNDFRVRLVAYSDKYDSFHQFVGWLAAELQEKTRA